MIPGLATGCGGTTSTGWASQSNKFPEGGFPSSAVALPGIAIDLASNEVRMDGQVCIEQGILEYLAVATGGKEYESIFGLNCRPSHLQAAMLIAGYEVGEVDPDARGDFTGGPNPTTDPAANPRPAGAPEITSPSNSYWTSRTGKPTQVTLDVEVRQADELWKQRSIESFLLDRRTGKVPGRMVWAFTGSFFAMDETTRREYFAADAEKSLIALWYDPTCLLNLTQDVGNPYRGNASGLEVNKTELPPRGTPVRLIVRKAPAHKGD